MIVDGGNTVGVVEVVDDVVDDVVDEVVDDDVDVVDDVVDVVDAILSNTSPHRSVPLITPASPLTSLVSPTRSGPPCATGATQIPLLFRT